MTLRGITFLKKESRDIYIRGDFEKTRKANLDGIKGEWEIRLTTKSRYGVRALFDMAYTSGTLPFQIKDISRRQKISPRYLEQIFQRFKKAGILMSKRGTLGDITLPERRSLCEKGQAMGVKKE